MDNGINILSSFLDRGTMAIVSSEENRFYLGRFKSSAGVFAATSDKAYFLIDSRYFEAAKKSIKGAAVLLLTDFEKQIKAIASENSIEAVIYETHSTSVSDRERLYKVFPDSLCDTDLLSHKLSEMRSLKSESERALIKEAQNVCDEAFCYILGYIKEGISERDVALELEWYLRKRGFGVSFDFIVASGENSSVPHAEVSDRILKKGDFITMDFGAEYKGYRSDMTRTVALGYASDEMKRVYDVVLKANVEAIKKIKEGLTCAQIDKIARDIIKNHGYGDFFGHGLGHGVGVEIHEAPSLSPKGQGILQNGMCVTVEPGIYIPNKFGVRIEDMGFITEKGFENITKSPKELIIL